MIDWEQRALDLAEVVIQFDKTGDPDFAKLMVDQAAILLQAGELVEAARDSHIAWVQEPDRELAQQHWEQHLERIRQVQKLLGVR